MPPDHIWCYEIRQTRQPISYTVGSNMLFGFVLNHLIYEKRQISKPAASIV